MIMAIQFVSRSASADLPTAIEWHDATGVLIWEDGTQILTVVECRDTRRGSRIYSAFDVVTIRCDEGYFELECNGEPWGWDYDDIGKFALLSGRVQKPSA